MKKSIARKSIFIVTIIVLSLLCSVLVSAEAVPVIDNAKVDVIDSVQNVVPVANNDGNILLVGIVGLIVILFFAFFLYKAL